ncbi:MAG: hypothetical protein ACON4U_15400 [Myxococcota bacterium]
MTYKWPIGFIAFGMGMSCSDYDLIKRDVGDVFYQLEASEVDILLVVDNSCSMEPYQQKLSENFDNFLTFFIEGDVDYQIGVTTTTVIKPDPYGICTQADIDLIPDAGGLVNNSVITSQTSGASEVFSSLVNVGTCGNGSEMGLEAGLLALEQSGQALIRPDAYLSVIFVSDEQDTSPSPVADYINTMRAIKDSDARDVFNSSALVVNDLADCTLDQINSGAAVGTRYIDVAEQTDGITGNICGDDFASIVTELSLSSSRLNDMFFLSSSPDVASLILGINEVEIPCDSEDYSWSFELFGPDEEPVIMFDRSTLPPPDSKITVQYNAGDGNPEDFCTGGTEQ